MASALAPHVYLAHSAKETTAEQRARRHAELMSQAHVFVLESRVYGRSMGGEEHGGYLIQAKGLPNRTDARARLAAARQGFPKRARANDS